MRSPKRQGEDLAIVVVCLALVAVVVIATAVADAVTVKLHDAEPFQTWAEKSDMPLPPEIEVRDEKCNEDTAICVKFAGDPRVIFFPAIVAIQDYRRLSFWHEVGHLFQLAHNDEVQAGYPAVDAACKGTYSFYCAERFADAYRDCAASDRFAHDRDPGQFNRDYKPTNALHTAACAFIVGVAG